MQARLYPATTSRPLGLLILYALLMLVLIGNLGCRLIGLGGEKASIEPLPQTATELCLPQTALLKEPISSTADQKCSSDQLSVHLKLFSEDPKIYSIASQQDKIFLSQLKHCGKTYSAKTMLRQLFAATESVHIQKMQKLLVEGKTISHSVTQIKVDLQPVTVHSYSYQDNDSCYIDWVFWKATADDFSNAEQELVNQIFRLIVQLPKQKG